MNFHNCSIMGVNVDQTRLENSLFLLGNKGVGFSRQKFRLETYNIKGEQEIESLGGQKAILWGPNNISELGIVCLSFFFCRNPEENHSLMENERDRWKWRSSKEGIYMTREVYNLTAPTSETSM